MRIELPDQGATEALAARLAGLVRAGDVIALSGNLGVGKTVFARAFVRARGRGGEEVPSPTFTLVEIYDPAGPDQAATYHFDLFRIEAAEDAFELGIEDAFALGVSLIEWPERLGALLPAGHLRLTLAPGPSDSARIATLETASADWTRRLREADLA